MIDVSPAVRSNPFREWAMVYFDPKKTDEATLLKRLRTKGCSRASRDGLQETKLDPGTLTVENRLTLAGGVVLLSFNASKTRTATIRPPEGWTVVGGNDRTFKSGVNRFAIQVPKKAAEGSHTLKIDLQGTVHTLTLEVVRKVR